MQWLKIVHNFCTCVIKYYQNSLFKIGANSMTHYIYYHLFQRAFWDRFQLIMLYSQSISSPHTIMVTTEKHVIFYVYLHVHSVNYPSLIIPLYPLNFFCEWEIVKLSISLFLYPSLDRSPMYACRTCRAPVQIYVPVPPSRENYLYQSGTVPSYGRYCRV